MSEIHYDSDSQISKLIKEEYSFKLPKYGPSTTDPTYYEPTATRIANMKKGASAFEGVFDWRGKVPGKTKEEIAENTQKLSMSILDKGSVDVRFSKHGMTKEEISQVTMEKSLEADNLISSKKKNKADEKSQLEKEVETAMLVQNKLNEMLPDNDSGNSTKSE